MDEIRVVNKTRGHAYDIYIGRGSKWGNPFPAWEHGRGESIRMYRNWIEQQPDLMAALPELQGRVLGCHCKPLACHGDVLKELAERA